MYTEQLNIFIKIVENAGLVISQKKVKIFQTKIRFLGHNIENGSIVPIDRAIQFSSYFPDEIKEKTQLQRFLGSLNYLADFYKNLAQDAKPLFDRLKANPPEWTDVNIHQLSKR